MFNFLDDRITYKYGWDHFFENSSSLENSHCIRDYIKGPFNTKPLVFSEFYVTQNQQNSNENYLQFKTGIPDAWADYVIYSNQSPNNSDRNEMQKEDLNVAKTLRKRYRLYLGQGIPDPCFIHQCIKKGDIIPSQELRCYNNYCNIQNNKSSGLCLCCQKKYLIDCIDKYDRKVRNQNLSCICHNFHLDAAEESSEFSEAHSGVPFRENRDSNTPKPIEEIKKKVEFTKKEVACQVCPELSVEASKNNNNEKKTSEIDETKGVKAASTNTSNHKIPVPSGKNPTETKKPELPAHRSNEQNRENGCCCFRVKKHESDEFLTRAEQRTTTVVSPAVETKQKASTETQTDLKPITMCKMVQTDEVENAKESPRKCKCMLRCLTGNTQSKSKDSHCHAIHTCIGNSIKFLEKCPHIHRHIESNESYSRTFNTLKKIHGEIKSSAQEPAAKPQTGHVEKDNLKRTRQEKILINENETLKGNQKMYYCTFSPTLMNQPESCGRERNHSRTKSYDPSLNNQIVYHCTPKVNMGISNFFSRNFHESNANLNNYLPSESPFFYKSNLEGRRFASFKLEERSLENQKIDKFRPTLRNVGTMTNATEILKRDLSIETKFLKSLDTDESTTYGLVTHCKENPNERRRGKRATVASKKRLNTNKKFSTQNNISVNQLEKRFKKLTR